ncbi:MAG: phenylalanine--tRNA ligase subunit alpha [Pseudomonadota bacterium]
MADPLDALETELVVAIDAADDLRALDDLRVGALGKKGRITDLAKSLGQLPPEERRAFGQRVNGLKEAVGAALERRKAVLEAAALDTRLAAEQMDVTLPVRPTRTGRLHPVQQVTEEIVAIFADMGFDVAEGPDIDDDFHNFTALNFPPEHPARQMHDTFFVDGHPDLVLRTHTSTVQIRTMMAMKPPIRIIAPGRTFRCDSDATHSPMFHQVEGLVIDRTSHMGHLKGCLQDFCAAFFERENVPLRFRPSFFPFTEPSAEVDIGCRRSKDELVIGEGDDWLEILGCGMVHPAVLENVGIDPTEWQGFAFGMGIDRVAMLKYGIPDLRTFFESDVRWLRHYGFSPLDLPTTFGGLAR